MIKKIFYFALVAWISLNFVACNKDGDILVDNPSPEFPKPDSPSGPEINLGFSVIEYTPAPGQYINDAMTGFSDVNLPEEACIKAEERFQKGLFVSLGGWGGYIVIKFDSSVKNNEGFDFEIESNAFDTSNEPGIVWVMSDTNNNGKPDDTWFELKGSHFGEDGYERNYWVTYTRPKAEEDTPWEDSNGEKGSVKWMGNFHDQPFYYPKWVKEDIYTLYGSRLPSRAIQNQISGIWENLPFEWGYADNFGNDFFKDGGINKFDIDNAVNLENEAANLNSIDFIKVQTAINGNVGILGENSTEICGFFPLN